MKIVKILDAEANEQIKAQYENPPEAAKGFSQKLDDLGGYLI